MAQMVLPLLPDGAISITNVVSYTRQGDTVYFFYGGLPVFTHAADDDASFRMFTSQLVVNGACKQVDIVEAFGVTPISVKRNVKRFRERGAQGFFDKAVLNRKPRVLTEETVERAQALLNEGHDIKSVAQELGLKRDTLRKAVLNGRLAKGGKKRGPAQQE